VRSLFPAPVLAKQALCWLDWAGFPRSGSPEAWNSIRGKRKTGRDRMAAHPTWSRGHPSRSTRRGAEPL